MSRASCTAVAEHDARACRTLALRADRARCAREADRWGPVLSRPLGHEAKPLTVAGRLRIVDADAHDARPPLDEDMRADLERGVVLVEGRGGDRIVIGAPSDTDTGFFAASPHVKPTLGLELDVPNGAKEARVERVQLVVPGRPPLLTPVAHGTLAAKLGALVRERGGEVSLNLDGDLGDAIGTCHVHFEASTFVRDVVKSAAPLTVPAAPPAHVGAGPIVR
jgi:hypothetical protein